MTIIDETRQAIDAATRAATHALLTTPMASTPLVAEMPDDADAADDVTNAIVAFLLRCCRGWYRMYQYGSDWSAWPAYLSFFRHVAKLDLPTYDKWQHYEVLAQQSAGRMLHTEFCIVADRHVELHMDAQNRPHGETGPAKRWADGWAVWYWHGVHVPRSLIEGSWTVRDILRESNSERRRCAIERMGWDRFIAEADLRPVATAPDPGNPPYELLLYDLPEGLRHTYPRKARILLCTNGTPEPDGTRHRFGLPVPAHHSDPVAAAAELYDWPVEAYRRLEVRR